MTKPKAIPGKAEWTEGEDNKVHRKTLKIHTGFTSGVTHYCDKRRNPVWFFTIFLNTFLTPRISFGMDRMETNGRRPRRRGQLPAEHLKPEVGESCGHVLYLFIKFLLLPRGISLLPYIQGFLFCHGNGQHTRLVLMRDPISHDPCSSLCS